MWGLFLGLNVVSFGVFAQDEFEDVRVIDRPRYSLTNRLDFVLDGSFLPLDGYYKPLLVEGAFNYQPTDSFSWEVARFGYSLYNHDTGLAAGINARLKAQGINQEVDFGGQQLKDMKYHISSTAFFNLLYSKSNFFNTRIAYYYWQLGGGFSYYDMQHGNHQEAIDLVMRIRFFLSNHWSFNIRAGHSIGFKPSVPNNITFLGLGVGFAL